MNCLDLQDIKKHLNIDFDDDDSYLSDLIVAAEEAISTYLNRPMSDFRKEDGTLSPSVKHAVRLMVGAWYANREPVTYGTASTVPYTLGWILTPLKRFVTEEQQ